MVVFRGGLSAVAGPAGKEGLPTMGVEELIEYHRGRARSEMDLGLTATNFNAAWAHMKLSSLHMQKLRQIQGANQMKPMLVM